MLDSLDDFLHPVEGRRELTALVRRLVFDGEGLWALGPHAGALTRRLLDTFPSQHVHVIAMDGRALGRAGAQGLEWTEVEATAEQVLRSALRQDPDTIAITRAGDAPTVTMLAHAALTGHQVLVGVELPGQDAHFDGLLAFAQATAEQERFVLSSAARNLATLDASGKVNAVLRLGDSGALEVAFALEGGRYVRGPAPLPRPKVVEAPAPDVRDLPPPASTAQRRTAWLPRVEPLAQSPSRLAASSALLPPGATWPTCAGCRKPLQHVVQLDSAQLPAALWAELDAATAKRTEGTGALPEAPEATVTPSDRAPERTAAPSGLVVQLLLCGEGCDTGSATAPGVWLRALAADGLVEVPAPATPPEGFAGGGVVEWLPREEEPHPEDVADSPSRPLRADKLGGWPDWEQGPAWPDCPTCAARMALLFQFTDEGDSQRPSGAGWDDARSVSLPGTPHRWLFNPQRPVHLPGFLTGGDAVAFLFCCARHPEQLAFTWQTS